MRKHAFNMGMIVRANNTLMTGHSTDETLLPEKVRSIIRDNHLEAEDVESAFGRALHNATRENEQAKTSHD